MKESFITIDFPVFCNYVVHVEIASDLHAAMQKYPTTRDVPLQDTQAIVVHKDNAAHSFMFLKPTADAGTIAHESYHIARRILRYMGCEPDNETIAYHLGYIVNKITKFMRKKRRSSR